MKISFRISFLLAFTSIHVMAQNEMEVTIKNIKVVKGTIQLALHNNENDFLKKPIDGRVVSVKGKEVTIAFVNLKSGNYAIGVYHDANENNEMDSNMLGIPKEAYGFSNNVMGKFGPPTFSDAKVKLDKQVKLNIELR